MSTGTSFGPDEERRFQELCAPLRGQLPTWPSELHARAELELLSIERSRRAAELREACLRWLASPGDGSDERRRGATRSAAGVEPVEHAVDDVSGVVVDSGPDGNDRERSASGPVTGEGAPVGREAWARARRELLGELAWGELGLEGDEPVRVREPREPPRLDGPEGLGSPDVLRLARTAQVLDPTPDGSVVLAATRWCLGDPEACLEALDALEGGWRGRAVDPVGTARLGRLVRALVDLERGRWAPALGALQRLGRGGEGTRALLGGVFLLALAAARRPVPGIDPQRALGWARSALDELLWRGGDAEPAYRRERAGRAVRGLAVPLRDLEEAPRPAAEPVRAVEVERLLRRMRQVRDPLLQGLCKLVEERA